MNDAMIKDIAGKDFDRAYSKAVFKNIVSKFKGQSNKLISFNEVMRYLKVKNESYGGMRYIPIDEIVGSEGRYNDFTREFLPDKQMLRRRWQSVDEAHLKDIILPPIKVYQLGGVYFVRDGNHRVSVARRQGCDFIDAEVTDIQTDIKLTPGMSHEELMRIIIAHEKEIFLENTKLDQYRDVSMLDFSCPGRFDDIMTHICGHQYYMGIDQNRYIDFSEAMLNWYDTLYMPIIHEIEEHHILKMFKDRTSSDLYLWIMAHWDDVKKRYGQDVPLSEAVESYGRQYGKMSMLQRIIFFFKKLFGMEQE